MTRTLGKHRVRRVAIACVAAGAMAGVLSAPASANFFVGSGVASGTVNFGSTSVPDLLQTGCNSVSWTFSAGSVPSAGGFLSLGGNAFAGTMSISASGSDTCEFITQGNGPATVNFAFGGNVTGEGSFF